MKVFCFPEGPEGNGEEASLTEAAVCRTVYIFMYICLFCFGLFFLHCLVLNVLRDFYA